MQAQVERYLHHLEVEREASPVSLKNYRSTLNRFALFLGDRELTPQSLVDFMSTFKHSASANVVRARLVGFAKYLKMDTEDVFRRKEPSKVIQSLSSSQVTDLVIAARRRSESLAAVVVFLSETGLRFQEFIDFNPCQIQTVTKRIKDEDGTRFRTKTIHWLSVLGKGRKLRRVVLSRSAFAAAHLLPLNLTRWAQELLRKELAQAGIDAGINIHVHPHLLRSTFISIHLNENNSEAIKIAKLVGHSSVDTMLNHYYEESVESLFDVVDGRFDDEEFDEQLTA